MQSSIRLLFLSWLCCQAHGANETAFIRNAESPAAADEIDAATTTTEDLWLNASIAIESRARKTIARTTTTTTTTTTRRTTAAVANLVVNRLFENDIMGVDPNSILRPNQLKANKWLNNQLPYEISSAFSFWHEQGRLDRDQYIQLNLSNVAEFDRLHNFQKYLDPVTADLGEPYDLNSLMHFDAIAFAVNKNIPTVKPLPPNQNAPMGQRVGLTPGDIKKINKMYPPIGFG
ncbi:putative Meprin A subunit alpha [Hypsibius exemplaris]|uniref:Metalloendopeptidase n=1 Tax=Hypsibius exemplaris TaxID=2072580 RepID=A0A1W0XFA4_HYPEX|nr:putative Meprin A subunit alpha [Hypsibius exemplaris]